MYKFKVKLEKCAEHCVPIKNKISDAGYDLRSEFDLIIPPHSQKLVSTGIRIELPVEENYVWEAQIRPRSGLALKKRITITNSPGTIDQFYTGVIGVILNNEGDEPFEIKAGDRIAQMVVTRIPKTSFVLVDEINETSRGDDGFGSSGVK